MKLSEKAIDNPLNTWLFIITIFVSGFLAFRMLTIENMPEIDIPQIVVNVLYEGASSSEIEFQVNKELEQEFKSLTKVKKITSVASQGYGSTIIEFSSDVNINEKKFQIQQAINKILPKLPEDIDKPIIRAINLSNVPVMNLVLYGKEFDYIELKNHAKKIKDKIIQIPGIKNIKIIGGLDREIFVEIDPISLWGNKINLSNVINFFNKNNRDTSGGKLSIGQKDYFIKSIARFKDKNEIKRSILTYRNGKPIYLKDIGTIKMGTKKEKSFSRYNNLPAVNLSITKQSKINLIKLSEKIKIFVKKINKSNILPPNMNILVTGDQSKEIKQQVDDLTNNIIQGIIAVFLVLCLSMGLRNAIIASISIPFAIIFTMLGLFIFEETINNLTQFGLMLIIGIVVDGAIVVLENIHQHLEMGYDHSTAAKIGINEVGGPVLASGLTTMSGFAPMLFMTGIVGQFMGVIPKTVILALTGSLIFDHIIIPVLCSQFSKQDFKKKSQQILPWEKILNRLIPSKNEINISNKIFYAYQKMIRWSVKHRKYVILFSLIAIILGSLLMTFRPIEFFPEIDLGKFWINIELPIGKSLHKTNKTIKEIEKILKKYTKTNINEKGFIKYYLSSVGNTEISTRINQKKTSGSNIAQIELKMIDVSERDIGIDTFMSKIRKEILMKVSGIKINLEKPQSGPPLGNPVNIVISGNDIQILKQLSKNIKNILHTVPGAIEIADNYGFKKTEIQLIIDRSQAERYGINVREIQNMIFILNNGYKLSKYQYGQRNYEIRIKIKDAYNNSIDRLKIMSIYSNKLQRPIPITELCIIKLASGFGNIYRENFKRAITISANVNRDLYTTSQVSKKVMNKLSNFDLPTDYTMHFKGENEDRDESFEGLKFAFIIGIMIIYFIVIIQLQSFLQPFTILAAIPLSILGVSIALMIANQNLGIMVLFGLVSLNGIVVNDAIVLVSQINLFRKKEIPLINSVIQASEKRLRPILLTTFTTIGSLLPLILIDSQGFFTTMAWTIIGGLCFATLQILIVVPVVYINLELMKEKIKLWIKSKKLNKKLN